MTPPPPAQSISQRAYRRRDPMPVHSSDNSAIVFVGNHHSPPVYGRVGRPSFSVDAKGEKGPRIFLSADCGSPAESINSGQSETTLRCGRTSPNDGHCLAPRPTSVVDTSRRLGLMAMLHLRGLKWRRS